MEFLKRKHFSLWITLLVAAIVDSGYGLQGVPTWMCLGIKSPFIEFKNEIEILANTSVFLNITKDEQVLMHEEELQKLGTFIKPVDLRNSSTGYVKSDLTKKLPPASASRRKGVTENPIVEEMDRKEIELLEEEIDPNTGFPGLNNEDRKFIVPMALKNPANEPKKAPPPVNDFSTNIDDLKNHILMLQNMTKNDKNFKSKFVVFPSLQRDKNGTQAKTQALAYTAQPPPKKPIYGDPEIPEVSKSKLIDVDDHHDDLPREKITIIPQVLLLNDQTPPDDDDDRRPNEDRKETRVTYSRRRNFRKTSTSTTTTTTTTTMAPVRPSRRNPKRQRGSAGGERRNRKRQQNCKNLDTPRCQRQRRRQQLALSLNVNRTLSPVSMEGSQFSDSRNKTSSSLETDLWMGGNKNQDDDLKLSRSVRSHHTKRNSAAGTRSGMGMGAPHEGVPASRDFLLPASNIINNNQSSAYRENVDLNPDLCHKVDGMTYGQQKLCVLHTSIMPAISRGARAAIQECQHQFKNRRWNCSTTDDNTVFGPMSSIGSPEMAFIHALAAATVTSFIARSCRDGQLASCGCSRGARPKQLHDDWTWGGCGDDLEFAYKLSQNFIDIRERERKRGARGLVSVPQKNKLEEKLLLQSSEGVQDSESIVNGTSTTSMPEQQGSKLNSSQNRDETPSPFKQEDLLELQEKITKEILNSKLQEKEMLELKEKINREILNSKVFNFEHHGVIYKERRQHQRGGLGQMAPLGRMKNGISAKARSLMNLHNNEAGRRAVIKKTRITCKCHGVSGSCSLITCWQQLSSIREIGDYLREKYDAATEVKLNKRGRLQVKDPRYKVPTAHDLVYLDESPDWCRNNRQLQWPGTHGRVCNKTSSGLDGCAILCCGRGYNTKNIVVQERCNCKFHWCCQVKCEVCVKVLEEHTCK